MNGSAPGNNRDPHIAAYAQRCLSCGATEGFLRVSEETATYTQPVKELLWWGPGRVRVSAEGEKHYEREGVRTVAIRCSACGYTSAPETFAKGISDAA